LRNVLKTRNALVVMIPKQRR